MISGLRTGGDDAAVIQAAINAAPGTMIDVGPGPLTFKSQISITHSGTRVLGDGIGSTVVTIAYSSDQDIISLNGAGFAGIESMQFVSATGTTQDGALIRVANGHDCRIRDVSTWGDFFYHVAIDGGPSQYITWVQNCEFNPQNTDTSSVAIIIGQNGVPQDTWLQNIEMGGSNFGNCGLLVLSSGGLNIRDVGIINMAKQGFIVYPSIGKDVRNTFIHNLQVDTCGQVDPYSGGLIVSDGGGGIYDMNIESSWFSSNQGDGLIVKDVENGCLLTSKFYWNSGAGYYIDHSCTNFINDPHNQVVAHP